MKETFKHLDEFDTAWDWMKYIVVKARELNDALRKAQGGQNAITLDLQVMSLPHRDWFSMNPYRIDLRDGSYTDYEKDYDRPVNLDLKEIVTERFK